MGRNRYGRKNEDDPVGYRNGHQSPVAVKTTMGPVELSRPSFATPTSALLAVVRNRGDTHVCPRGARHLGLGVRAFYRDIEAAVAEVLGPEAALSRFSIRSRSRRI